MDGRGFEDWSLPVCVSVGVESVEGGKLGHEVKKGQWRQSCKNGRHRQQIWTEFCLLLLTASSWVAG